MQPTPAAQPQTSRSGTNGGGSQWVPPEPVIESPLDNNPDFLANLPMPTAQFDVSTTPRPTVTRDPSLAYARAQIADDWNEAVSQLNYSGVDRQFAEAFDRQFATPRSGAGQQAAAYGPEIDNSLYVEPWGFKRSYDLAAAGFDDPNSTLLDKAVYFAGAAATALPMMVEEAGRFILNAPHSASVGGQLLARGNQATDIDTKVESYLGAVSSFANAFNGFAGLTPPSLMLPAAVPNLNAVPAVTMSAQELAAVRATYAQDAVATMVPSRFSQLRGAATFLRDEALIIDPIKRREIIESFGPDLRLGSFEGQAYQYSGLQGTYSRYLTPSAVANPVRELALPPSNPALLHQQYTVAPTRALLGTAAPQNFGIPLPGGAQQIFIPSRDLLTPTLLLPTK